MAEIPKEAGVKAPPPAPTPKTIENPVFRMMGIPKFKLKLPSRNWLIFLSVTGSFTTALLYDRYHKKKAQQRWCHLVSHMAQDSLPTNQMPRRITILLSAPPGDGLRAAREHFHEYVKPILVAGALDWDVIEGRREGEVRAGFAEKIRKLRRRNGEGSLLEPTKEGEKDLLEQARINSGIQQWEGVQGDLIIGRHTWKEYIRGLHEGWLGPVDPPPPPPLPPSEVNAETSLEPISNNIDSSPLSTSDTSNSDPTSPSDPSSPSSSETPPTPIPQPPKPTPTPPYILPISYPISPLPSSFPNSLPPTLPLPLPHLLGFLSTPTRLYRFLTRRHLADATGASVAALVLATNSRPYQSTTTTLDRDASPSASPPPTEETELDLANEGKKKWEQEDILSSEEAEWHKIAWKENEPGTERERVWKETMVVDERVAARMRLFELGAEDRERAFREEADRRKVEEWAVAMWARGAWEWIGFGAKEEKKGWEMGLLGGEDD